MSKFKIGDRVRVIDNSGSPNEYKVGEVGIIVNIVGTIVLKGKSSGMYDERFELAHEYPNPPHKHCELIKVWADGGDIEASYNDGASWAVATQPRWNKTEISFRIKPQKSEKDIEIERIESEIRKLADDLAKVKSK